MPIFLESTEVWVFFTNYMMGWMLASNQVPALIFFHIFQAATISIVLMVVLIRFVAVAGIVIQSE